MKTKMLPFCFFLVGAWFCVCFLARAANNDSASPISVQQLIAQLGDEQYVLRRRAETQLLERGAEAFSQLKAAERHNDLEISTRARYILNQINIDWVRPTDPPAVRSIMARYGESSRQEKINKVVKLSELENAQGFSVLRRVAKYEFSGLVACHAIYYLANAQTRQGNLQEAEKLSQRALQIELPEIGDRNALASDLMEMGRHDWAEREWKLMIESVAATDLVSLSARQSLALYRLHDRLEYKAAADLLTQSIDAINADPQVKRVYQEDSMLGFLNRFRSNREYMLACHEESQGNFDRQRQHLELANQLEGGNADILIAMFHLAERSPGASDAFRKTTQRRLSDAKEQLEKEISSIRKLSAKQRKTPGVRAALAQRHNHWAWLVSNTEGDFEKAVKFSQRSLELAPGSPSYLDTLGRCYYAAGDLENALKVQREAIVKHPHMLVMQRQLKEFEDALQKRESDKAGG